MSKVEDYHIEELRKRAKDYKAEATQFFLNTSLQTLQSLSNLILLTSFAILGYLRTFDKIKINNNLFLCLKFSILSGILFTVFLFLFNSITSSYYSDLEQIWSVGYINEETYNENLNQEGKIKHHYSYRHQFYKLSILALSIQVILLVYVLFSLS